MIIAAGEIAMTVATSALKTGTIATLTAVTTADFSNAFNWNKVFCSTRQIFWILVYFFLLFQSDVDFLMILFFFE